MKTDKLLKPEEIADMLGVSRKTVVIMAREQRLPCVRVGRLVRFDAKEIRRWIDNYRR